MDFILSYRLFRPPAELKHTQIIENPYYYLSHSYFESFLLLSVTNYKWKFIIFNVIFVRIVLTTYVFTFTAEDNKEFQSFDYVNLVCDTFFFIDFLSAVTYRIIYPKRHRHPFELKTTLKKLVWRNELYAPRKAWMLALDVFSLLPFELLRFLTEVRGPFRTICHYVPVVRIYRPIASHFQSMKCIILETSLILRLVLKCGIVWLLGMHVFTCIFRWVSWYKGSNFVNNVEAAICYDRNETLNLFIVMYYAIQFSFENIGFGDLPPTTDMERLVIVITTLVGFSMLNGYIISSLTNAIGEKLRRITFFCHRLNLIKTEMNYRKVPAEKIDKIVKFYESLWTFREGVGSSEIRLSFPQSIWDNINYDIFVNALNTSLLFRSCDEPSKRAIARVMKTELYTTGDVILKRCRANSKMFYVKKGTLEIMSHEDDETPIMTFGAGSVFGQIALLLSVPAISEIHAVAFCEIQVLTRKQLFLVIQDYPQTKDIIFNVHKVGVESVEFPKSMQILINMTLLSLIRICCSTQWPTNLKLISILWGFNFFPPLAQSLFIFLRLITRPNFKKISKAVKCNSNFGCFMCFVRIAKSDLRVKSVCQNCSNQEARLLYFLYIFQMLSPENTNIAPGNILSSSLFYKVPRVASKVAQNDICVVRTCPYVYEPQTIFLKIWDILVVINIVLICFLYPYWAAFKRIYPDEVQPFVIISDLILVFNIYLSFSTAIVKENVLISSLHEIAVSKLSSVYTYIDILAVTPLHYFIHNKSRVKPLILCLRCMELYKVHLMFIKAESSITVKISVFIRLIKCILYFFFIGYIVGILYYLEACYEDPCIQDSWYVKNNVTQNTHSPVWSSLYIAILLVSGTGFGDILPKNTRDVICIIFFCFFGSFLFIYLKSEYSAVLSLRREPMHNLLDFADRIIKFLVVHRVSQNEVYRVRQYLNLQWEWNKGYEFTAADDLFHDTPKHMKNELTQYTKFSSLKILKNFIDLTDSVYAVLSSASRVIFPPHEAVIYADEVCKAVFVLEEGFCELTYGKDVTVKKIVSTGEELCTVEILLGLTSLCHVRTLTHCIFLKIPKECLIGILKLFPMVATELKDNVVEFKKTEIYQSVRKARPIHLELVVRKTVQNSLFHFRYFRRNDNEEYNDPYKRLGLCQWLKFILGSSTILPYGKLLKAWEFTRCVFSFCSALVFPLLPYIELQVPVFTYIAIFLDISAWVDLYFRMHVCYYNNKHLLVSHPLYTAAHYLKGSFTLDFAFCFPFDRIMFRRIYDYKGYAEVTSRPINILRLLRIPQIYRIPPTVNNFGVDFLSPPSLLRVSVMMAAMTIVFINTWTSILILFCFNYKVNKKGSYILQITDFCVPHFTSLQRNFNTTTQPFSIYLVDFYWVAGTVFTLGYGDITAETTEHMAFVICKIIISYLFLSILSVVVVSFLTSIDVNLTRYQTKMSNLIKFLKAENVKPLLIKHIINHFEHEWKKTKGMKAQIVVKSLHTSLESDVLFHLFEDTLKNVGAFSKVNPSLIRILCSQVQENFFIEGAAIYKTRDKISEVFIISKGQVTLVGKNEEETTTLGPFEIFGNLENVPISLTDKTAVATKYVTILTIKTRELYKSYVDFSVAEGEDKKQEVEKLRTALYKSNEIKSRENAKKSSSASKNPVPYYLYLGSKYIMFFYLILSWFSINEVSHSLAFQTYDYAFVCFTVVIEFLFIMKIFLGFFTGYVNKSGEFISNYRLIRRRYMKVDQFYADFISVLPIELFCYAFKKEDEWFAYTILRIPKYFRGLIIQQFFNLEFESLRVNMVLLKMIYVTVWSATLVHQCACIWYFVSCPRAYCPDSRTWYLIKKGFYSDYLTSLYFIVNLLTSTGTGDVTPHAPVELILAIFLMMFAFFLAAIFTGVIISTISKYLLAKTNYEYSVFGLKTFLSVNGVLPETQYRVFRYIGNIWRHERGRDIPSLLRQGPAYLINEIKQSTYGYHIHNNPVFKECDPSFRNLIINELHRSVYFTGDVIVHEGEVNRTMYFVHLGLVESKNYGQKSLHQSYGTGNFFGMKQGAHRREPHTTTYVAATYSIILCLNFKHWIYLSQFYPKDVEYVKNSSEKH